MARRIFISYEGEDRNRAKGFRLLRWNDNVDVDFVDRSLLDPVRSRDPNYIKNVIRDKMKGTSVVVVIVGKKTHESEWVKWEIEEAVRQGKGLLGIRIKDEPDTKPPSALLENGGELIDWNPDEFNEAIERAAGAPVRVGSYTPGTQVADAGCARPA